MVGSPSPQLPQALQPLLTLALDLRWTWSHEADALWERLDPDLWEQTHSPWVVLQQAAPDRLAELAADAGFRSALTELVDKRNAHLAQPGWFHAAHDDALGGIAYFSMEFGLGSALPLYAGGLGVLAGDYLKAASDLGVPVVGMGLLYQEGYFRQTIDADGVQHETYPYNDPSMMPIEPVLVDDAWLRVVIELPGRSLHLRVWRASVGRLVLHLLDSNDPLNSPADRAITSTLYGDDPEIRLLQEIVLGVGGWRALEALGRKIEICHLNEGHAAFLVIERARRLAAAGGLDFQQALVATRVGNVFTTHTPMASGFDLFDPDLLLKHLTSAIGAPAMLGLSRQDLLALGRANADDEAEPFNMAYLAMRGSGTALGVSRLHGQVSRQIFQPLFPRWPERQVPVGHVTNGVHTPTWDSAEADQVWTEACGKERWRDLSDEIPDQIGAVSDADLWTLRGRSRQILVGRIRRRLAIQLHGRGLDPQAAEGVLDPNILTLGFARRFTDYKRPNLLLRDPQRLARLLLDERRPAQIVVAGKAHPADLPGKAMIRDWIALAGQPRFRRRVVFLEDYDIGLAQELVQGVDVWINTPRRPSEACGTSGMKVLVNGGLNCSVGDGWWDEAYAPEVGWRIGDGEQEGSAVDAAEAEDLYHLIEHRIAPEFYDRDAAGVPRAWVARVRASMTRLTAAFSGARMVRDYVETVYLPAAAALRRRTADGGAVARDLADWSNRLRPAWPSLHIGAPSVSRADDHWRVSVPVFLGEVSEADVRVELYADPLAGGAPQIIPLEAEQAITGAANGYVFAGLAPAARPASDFTVRVVPAHAEAHAPTDLPLIAWQA